MIIVYSMLFLAALPWIDGQIDVTTDTNCYHNSSMPFNVSCSPIDEVILIHSVEGQNVTSCNESSLPLDGQWSRRVAAVYLVWLQCNLQKERCSGGRPNSHTFLRINYTCVSLGSLRRQNMCNTTSKSEATPFYLDSPNYPDPFDYTGANCTCHVSTPIQKDITVVLHFMLTVRHEKLTLRWPGNEVRQFQTKLDDTIGNVHGYNVTKNLSDFHISFVPENHKSLNALQGYFWVEVSTTGNGSVSVACNGGLLSTTTQPPTTASPTTSTQPISMPTTSLQSSVTPSSTTSSSVTGIPPSIPQGVVGITDDDLKLIYIVVPTVLIALIILIVIIVIVKKRPHQHYTKTDDTIRFKPSDFSSDDIYSRENFAVEMVDNDIYHSQDSLSNGSLSGPVSLYGVGVAFGTFKGEKVRHRSNDDLTDKAEEDTHDNKDKYRGMIALPKSETFGGEDLFIGAEVGGHDDDDGVVYAQVHKPVKKSVVFDLPYEHGQAGSEHEEFTNNNQIGTDSSTDEIEEYSLADDFDDPNEYCVYDIGSKSNETDDEDGDGDDYAIAYTRRRSSKRREPQQSLHIYDDVNEDDFAELGSNGAISGEVDEPQPDNMDDEQDDGDYDALDFRGEKHKKKIDKIVDIQRTEL